MSESNDAGSQPAHREVPGESRWSTLRHLENEALAERWQQAFPDVERARGTPRIGLALSGGGIRSATFCIGLMRGLAQNRVLRRFDYLSTVSGGGYAGSVFGRLVATLGIDKAEETLAAGDSIILTWLRRYGRYLTPAGARDFGMLIATYLRSAIAVQLEIGFIALLVALLVIAPHVLLPGWVQLDETSWQPWRTFWWPLAFVVWLASGPALMTAYWNVRGMPDGVGASTARTAFEWRPLVVLLGINIFVLGWAIWSSVSFLAHPPYPLPPSPVLIAVATAGIVAVLAWLAYSVLSSGQQGLNEFVAEKRNGLTRALRFVNKLAVALAFLGALDLATRMLAQANPSSWLTGGLGGGALLAILLRGFSEPLQKLANAPDSAAARWVPRLINFAGLGVGLLVMGAWVVLAQWLVFDENSWALMDFLTPFQRAGLLLVFVALWFVLTRNNHDTVNASSLHSFYRARLIRAYLSVGNPSRFTMPIQTASSDNRAMESIPSVTEVTSGDDIALRDYAPEKNGGPIHLVCGCINQTIDDRSNLFNADRKGAAIVASWRAIEVGLDEPVLAPHVVEKFASDTPTSTVQSEANQQGVRFGSLGQWVAISGAAAAPGAGSNTTSGWALLLFMVGARLGYWLDSLIIRADCTNEKARRQTLRESKSGLLLTEALAWFGGKTRRWWFLSDGGHFDNTGVYALLRRELDCIVLADCGADPKFEFSDLENLIRKARIDFDADIEFYTRREVQGLFPPGDANLQVLALEDMQDNSSVRGILLARICYHSSDPARRRMGSLLVVKPNLHEALDRDLLAYAARNPSFPQQSTGDQFFDEAQWESYHRLGHDFGRAMTGTWLRHVPGWRVAGECPIPFLPLRRVSSLSAESKVDALPFWRRGIAATALGTGIGVGALGTLLLSGWQVIESVQTRQREEVTRTEQNRVIALSLLEQVAFPVATSAAKLRDCLPVAAECSPKLDLDPVLGSKLRTVYEASRTESTGRAYDPFKARIDDVQTACGTLQNICGQGVQVAPNLCLATCDAPTPVNAYFAKLDRSDDWKRNPIGDVVVSTVRLARSAFGWFDPARGRLADRDAMPADAPAPPPPRPEIADPMEPENIDQTSSTTNPKAADDEMLAQQSAQNPDNLPVPQTGPAVAGSPSAVAPIESAAGPADDVAAAPVIAETGEDWSTCLDGGKPVTIYVQIFDEALRGPLVELDKRVLGSHHIAGNVSVAGIENVVATATRRETRPPRSQRTPTLIVHRDSAADQACASKLRDVLQPEFDPLYPNADDAHISIRTLPASLATRRHVIELWLPTPNNLAQ